ncbi:hypothetical protein PUN28_018676 [Cardiocondyla obscurior]|uniref:Ribosomal protein S14 n=1 Tax=Cardiocondyla obscurior TaxID=286306 RepID=A0AAW2EKF3_9HYME
MTPRTVPKSPDNLFLSTRDILRALENPRTLAGRGLPWRGRAKAAGRAHTVSCLIYVIITSRRGIEGGGVRISDLHI